MMKEHFLRSTWNTRELQRQQLQQRQLQERALQQRQLQGRELQGRQLQGRQLQQRPHWSQNRVGDELYLRPSNFSRNVVQPSYDYESGNIWYLPAASTSSTSKLSIISGVGIIGIVLFVGGIAATVSLALIPFYLPKKDLTPSPINKYQTLLNITIALNDSYPVGVLHDPELSNLLSYLTSSLSSDTLKQSGINIVMAEIILVDSTSNINNRDNPLQRKVLVLETSVSANAVPVLQRVSSSVQQALQNVPGVITQIVPLLATQTSTTTTTTTFSTLPTNLLSSTTTSGAGRRRRDLDEYHSTILPPVTYQD